MKPQPGDWEATTYLFFSQLAVMVVCVAPLLATGYPAVIIMGSFLPAFAWQHVLGHGYCALSALRLAKTENRTDVTALPGLGVDLVSSITITFGVLMPTWIATGDAYLAWGLGLAVNLLFGLTKILLYPFVGILKSLVPRASLLGLLSGLMLIYVGTTYGITIMEQPYVAFFTVGVVLATMFGRWLDDIPLLPVVFVLGSVIGYFTGSVQLPDNAFDISFNLGGITTLGFSHLWSAAREHIPLVVPLALGNQLLRNLSNLAAAEAVGDRYDAREVMIVDGALTTVGGALLGSWMPTFLLSGHPGWKESGARTFYPALTAVAYAITGFTGLLWVLREIIPEGVVAGVFIWLALAVTHASIRKTPPGHLPAVLVSFIPIGAYLIVTQVTQEATSSASTHLQTLALGFPFTAIIWSAIVVHLIDRRPYLAAGWCMTGAVLTFFGLMHSSFLGVGAQGLPIVGGYLVWAVTTLIVYFLDTVIRRSRS